QVRRVDHVAAAPPVEEDADERPDDRVRQQQHGERGRDPYPVRRLLRAEQQAPGERGLEEAVPELADHPDADQVPEGTATQDGPQVSARRHALSLRGSGAPVRTDRGAASPTSTQLPWPRG